jgi:cellobiose phosphorylase
LTASRTPDGWDASTGGFIGCRRTLANPRAVAEGASGNSRQAMWPSIASLHFRLQLAAGGCQDLRLIAGACDREPMIVALRHKYRAGTLEHDPHFTATLAEQQRITRNIQLQTPEPTIDRMLTAWVKKQIHLGVYWGRWGWKGYRDVVQQCLGLLTQDADLARAGLLEACRHQYQDGFALRGWRPVDTMRYADSAQWLIHAVTEYLKETGDWAFLDQRVPYFDGGEGTVHEHLQRALERLHQDRGIHGLCLAHGGDWNDSLTGVGRRGRGESVWLSMAFCRCALLLQELAEYLGRAGEAAQLARWHGDMAAAINTHAWDGNWYLCALDDDGQPVGSASNEQGKIFLNMQSWAQLGRVADDRRWERAWAAVQRHLDCGWGLMLNWPCYTTPRPNIGRMSYIRPGAAENGSVYTHGNAFMFLALLERGQADSALKLWRDIIPDNPNRPTHCQPNVFFNGFYGPDSEILAGLADHAWMTGSVAWMFFGVVEYLLGLRRGYAGLTIRPCLPASWPSVQVTRAYRGATYHVTVHNPGGLEAAPVESITVDGQPHSPDQPLPLDGKEHEVVVRLAAVGRSSRERPQTPMSENNPPLAVQGETA